MKYWTYIEGRQGGVLCLGEPPFPSSLVRDGNFCTTIHSGEGTLLERTQILGSK